jgi:hypothetical protein
MKTRHASAVNREFAGKIFARKKRAKRYWLRDGTRVQGLGIVEDGNI